MMKAQKLKGKPWETDVEPILEKETISLFRYVDRKNKDSGLLTTLYAPYWDNSAKRIYGLKLPNPRDLPDSFDNGGFDAIDKFTFIFSTKWEDSPKKRRKRSVKVKNLCNLCYDPGKTIGTNFLDNEGLKAGQTYDKIKNKSELANNTKSSLPVGLFCIVSRACVIGNSGMVTEMLQESVDGDDIHVFMEEEKSSVKNRLSIGAIVLWKEAPPRASHYFAGDLSYEVETRVGEWLAEGGQSKITNIKLRQAPPLSPIPASRAALTGQCYPTYAGTAMLDGSTAAINYANIKHLGFGQPGFYGVPAEEASIKQSRKDFWDKINILYKELGGKKSGGVDHFFGIHDQAGTWFKGLSIESMGESQPHATPGD
ncbi:hypothetical protein ONZ43_g6475 [Nemania bipapillata]|uniref:Uncharacterized protein n=1 Tax=Nemania bipapillata TaxID=110536 RepID=A0ACC2I010_9PEZI|nr:hypothetical protein ONZ43_g6475 [Nemania bipapillata]